jgi:2-hydroxy-3-keto-5-methylthiopentenyl-1-phosphate phosphatase
MLILCDFDGTVTAVDTNTYLAKRFAPSRADEVAGKLATREMTLREVLEAEVSGMAAAQEEIVAAAVEGIPFRGGFEPFVEAARAHGDRIVLLSAGFRQLIRPMLANAGMAGYDLELVANDAAWSSEGGTITWRDQPMCDRCGEQCKRSDVAALRARYEDDADTVVYIGDGFSDRCGAETADRIFARRSLAGYLDEQRVAYEWFDEFFGIATALWG